VESKTKLEEWQCGGDEWQRRGEDNVGYEAYHVGYGSSNRRDMS